MTTRLDLTPARWVWLPGDRCLPNTFVLFRRMIRIGRPLRAARGWMLADSRYRLTVDGVRVQWGPAPNDPRYPEADPLDLAALLTPGEHVLGVEVCYFAHGDGTWPMGAPGLILQLNLEDDTGRSTPIHSGDDGWLCTADRAHAPGQYGRNMLRALQEIYDARRHPHGWDTPGFTPDARWVKPALLRGSATAPAIFAGGPEVYRMPDDPAHYGHASQQQRDAAGIFPRSIPLTREQVMTDATLVESGSIQWHQDPEDWFQFRQPGSFTAHPDARPCAAQADGSWRVEPGTARYLMFQLPEQRVGFPCFTLDAPEGTVIELMVQESHDVERGPHWLDTSYHGWSRFITVPGEQTFEAFDYDSFRWMQLHIREHTAPVTVRSVGLRRRVYDWPVMPDIQCADARLQRLFDASVNTILNSCCDSNQDGAGRERQQYAGDCGHQQQAIRYAFGDARLSARYLKTFSQGMTLEGYFLDTWPATDRLIRIMQRQIGTTAWGPLLDHGVGFVMDNHDHFMETGRRQDLEEPYPRLVRFAHYLQSLIRPDGLLPVEDIGVPTVWIDHYSYQRQRDKRCAFNLYAAAMFTHSLPALAELFQDQPVAELARRVGAGLLAATVKHYWDDASATFIVNRDHQRDDGGPRYCDRSLATAVMYDQIPGGNTQAIERLLVTMPTAVGRSYPANAGWRYRALVKLGHADQVVREFYDHWCPMLSVVHNNALQENWEATMDSGYQFSHCALAPIFILMTDLLGLRPTSPGFATYRLTPRLAAMPDLTMTAHLPTGELRVRWRRGARHLTLTTPGQCRGELVAPDGRLHPLPERGTVELTMELMK